MEQFPVRRQSHPAPNRTIELIRQEVEAYALVFPNIAFSLQDTTKSKSHVLKIPKVTHLHFWTQFTDYASIPIRRVPLWRRFDIFTAVHLQRKVNSIFAPRDRYGRYLFQCVQEISATCGQLQIKGFISLVGAHTKAGLPFRDRPLSDLSPLSHINSCVSHAKIQIR